MDILPDSDYIMCEIGFNDSFSTCNVRPTRLFEPGKVPSMCVFEFSSGGSGFVIALPRSKLQIAGRTVTALGVTAGHCIGVTIQRNYSAYISVFDDRGYPHTATWDLLCNYADLDKSPSWDPINWVSYPIPNDIALIAIYDLRPLQKLSPSDPALRTPIVVAGQPRPPFYGLQRLVPSLSLIVATDQEKAQAINTAYHNFKDPVFSRGKIAGLSNHLIAITATTGNGMSGSPIILRDTNQVVGLLLGGPMVSGMYECLQLSHHLNAGISPKALKNEYQALKSLLQQHNGFPLRSLSSLIKDLQRLMLQRDPKSMADLATSAPYVSQLLENWSIELVKFAVEAKHNNGLSVQHPKFQEALGVARRFQALPKEKFASLSDFKAKLGL